MQHRQHYPERMTVPGPGNPYRVVDVVRNWQTYTAEHSAPEPELGSALASDAALSPQHNVGHAAWSGFVQAVDHLHAVQALITEAHMVHTYAPFALVRAALDNAALAVWLLAPVDQKDRLQRRLHLAYEDVRQSEKAYDLLGSGGPQPKTPHIDQRRQIMVLAGSLKLDGGSIGGRWTGHERVVRLAAGNASLDPDLVALMWRCCSGFAHGRQWASLALLKREVSSQSTDNEVSNMRFSATVDQVLVMAGLAASLNARARALYLDRSATPTPTAAG